jgi:hypothetical protein
MPTTPPHPVSRVWAEGGSACPEFRTLSKISHNRPGVWYTSVERMEVPYARYPPASSDAHPLRNSGL